MMNNTNNWSLNKIFTTRKTQIKKLSNIFFLFLGNICLFLIAKSSKVEIIHIIIFKLCFCDC